MKEIANWLSAIAVLAMISCNAGEKSMLPYTIVTDPDCTPENIKDWRSCVFLFGTQKCSYVKAYASLSEISKVKTSPDGTLVVMAAEDFSNIGYSLTEAGEPNSEYLVQSIDGTSVVGKIWAARTDVSDKGEVVQNMAPVTSDVSVELKNLPSGGNINVTLSFTGANNAWRPCDDKFLSIGTCKDLEISADKNGTMVSVFPPDAGESSVEIFIDYNGTTYNTTISDDFVIRTSSLEKYVIDLGNFVPEKKFTITKSTSHLLVPSVVKEVSGTYYVGKADRTGQHYDVTFGNKDSEQSATVRKALCSDAGNHRSIWNDWNNSKALRDTMSYSIIDTEFPVTVRVRKNEGTFSKVEIRPSTYGITAKDCGDNTVEFTIPSADKGNLSVEFDGDRYHNLFVYAMEPDKEKPDASSSSVIYYGAGNHHPGTINLTSGQTLYIDYGAIVYSKVVAEGSNITIAGHGVLCGSEMTHTGDDEYSWGDFLVNFNSKRQNVSNITVKDITMIDSPGWNMIIPMANTVRLDGVKMISWELNGDGIDIVCCKDVDINNCFIRTYDDAITLKCRFIVSPITDVYDVNISKCLIWSDYARGIVVGPEAGNTTSVGRIHGVTVSDCIFLQHKRSLTDDLRAAFAIGQGSDGKTSLWSGTTPPNTISDITVKGLVFDNIDKSGRAISIWQYGGTPKVTMSNVTFEDIKILDSAGNQYPPMNIVTKGSTITGLTVKGFTLNGSAVGLSDIRIDDSSKVGITVK